MIAVARGRAGEHGGGPKAPGAAGDDGACAAVSRLRRVGSGPLGAIGRVC